MEHKNQKTCPKCGASLPEDAVFCTNCGTKIEDHSAQNDTCAKCGAPLENDAAFCTNCGAPVNSASPAAASARPGESLTKGGASVNGASPAAASASPRVSLTKNGSSITSASSAAGAVPASPGVSTKNSDAASLSSAAPAGENATHEPPALGSTGNTVPKPTGSTDVNAQAGIASSTRVPIYLWPLLITILAAVNLGFALWDFFDPVGAIASVFSTGTLPMLLVLGGGTAALYIIDIIYLSSIGIRGGWKWSVLIPPLYMFIRAAKTNRKYLLAIIYIIILVAGIVLNLATPYALTSGLDSYAGVPDDEEWMSETYEALPDGQPVTYAELIQDSGDLLESVFDGDVSISGTVSGKETEDSAGTPALLYTVAAEGNPGQVVEVLCTEAVPDPEPNVGDEVLCDGMYMGTASGLPRIIGTVFVQDTRQKATSRPSASAAATPARDFTLDRTQADALAEEVAGPLLFAEWYGTSDAVDYYDDSVWSPARTVQVADISGRREPGEAAPAPTIWLEFVEHLFDVFYSNGEISAFVMEAPAVQAYFRDAFGRTDIIDVIEAPSEAGTVLQTDAAGNWSLPGSDPGYILTMNLPGAPVQVMGGKVAFTGYMQCDADWVAPLAITLDVEQDPASRYGCHVVSYTVTPADMSVVPLESRPMAPVPTATPNQAPVVSAASAPAGSFDANGFIFPDSSVRYLTEADIAGLSPTQLGFARNEIFARNGNLFRKDTYANHYSSYSWYNNLPNKRYDVDLEELNDVERANVNLIRAREAQLG